MDWLIDWSWLDRFFLTLIWRVFSDVSSCTWLVHVTHAFREYRLSDRYSHFNNIGNSLSERAASPPHQNLYEGQYNGFLPATTAYKMGRRLPDEVVYRIRIRLEASEEAPAITKAVGVGKKTIYKLQLNLNI